MGPSAADGNVLVIGDPSDRTATDADVPAGVRTVPGTGSARIASIRSAAVRAAAPA